MAHYKNQEDMFKQRAENNKKQGDYHYAQSKEAEARGDKKPPKTTWHKHNTSINLKAKRG
ncbi:hypothetical protein HHE02_17330 [Helicobacter heilmannii]|uniref:hypothetical protein n=1 Tax=Helicobacter heilmannii TaxID=35817 RepID=UPI0006A08E90|nr:hypothetical protein [Helicobacter heilmannii]CRF48408.1 hypothetical protein HHE02_17330 [Helicobacter heilmannii]